VSAPIRVALVSPCGWGNLGDAAIFDSLIAAVRRRLGDVGIVGLTMNPDDTAKRHGIEARSLLGYSRPQFPVMAPGGARRPEAPAGGALPAWLARARPLRRALTAGGLIEAQRAHERESVAAMAGCQFVVVAGGGQLDELWGGSLAQPVALWRWSAVARRLGARFVVLSVGTGKLDSPLGRRFVARALAAAQVVSFRDAGSRDLAPLPRGHASALVPDLAYAVPRPASFARAMGRVRPLVALGPISHRDPRGSPEEDADAYGRNVRALAALARRLVETDHDVALFTTAPSDEATVEDLLAALADAPAVAARLRAYPAAGASVAGLLELLATADVVVAARLHAVLLSHVMGRPVVALSYERKVEALMRDTGQMASCLVLDGLDAEEAFAAVSRALRDGPALSAAIAARVAGFRDEVERQYDRVFGPVLHTLGTDRRD
jgi:polysaccharide pyruvyl transferase WcaK-like protein